MLGLTGCLLFSANVVIPNSRVAWDSRIPSAACLMYNGDGFFVRYNGKEDQVNPWNIQGLLSKLTKEERRKFCETPNDFRVGIKGNEFTVENRSRLLGGMFSAFRNAVSKAEAVAEDVENDVQAAQRMVQSVENDVQKVETVAQDLEGDVHAVEGVVDDLKQGNFGQALSNAEEAVEDTETTINNARQAVQDIEGTIREGEDDIQDVDRTVQAVRQAANSVKQGFQGARSPVSSPGPVARGQKQPVAPSSNPGKTKQNVANNNNLSSTASSPPSAPKRIPPATNIVQSQSLKDIVALRRYFKAGNLCITSDNAEAIRDAQTAYMDAFSNYNQGVIIGESLDSDLLGDILRVFTHVRQLKMNVPLTNHQEIARVIADSIQFYKSLYELNIAGCNFDDSDMREILGGLLGAAEEEGSLLTVLDISSNNISADVVATVKKRLPQLSSFIATNKALFTGYLSPRTAKTSNTPASPRTEQTEENRLIQIAKQGKSEDQYGLGWKYANGRDVPKDDQKARFWYEQAARQGHPEALFKLGRMCVDGTGGPKDEAQGCEWYEQAALQGHSNAQCNLGVMYAKGFKDERKACKWFRMAANNQLPEAQNNLGIMLANGIGVWKNEGEACMWYDQAARQKHPMALYNLAVMRETGRGIEKSERTARELYMEAAKLGHSGAAAALQRLGN